jgi:hypothetical protein
LFFRFRCDSVAIIPEAYPYYSVAHQGSSSFFDPRYVNPLTSKMAGFLLSIGLATAPAVLDASGFLKGLMINHGVLLIDEVRLTYPGDLLHEAGHLAVIPGETRKRLHGNVGVDPGEEMAAIAWSYAAALHLEIDPAVVFHSGGYRGGSQAILENFSQGRYVGVPLLDWLGLTAGKKNAERLHVPPYPHMLKWLRE